MAPKPSEGGKLASQWKGPYVAEKTDSPWNYRITDRDGNKKTVHIDQLKECHNDEPLADGLRGRGRPTRYFYAARPRRGREV